MSKRFDAVRLVRSSFGMATHGRQTHAVQQVSRASLITTPALANIPKEDATCPL